MKVTLKPQAAEFLRCVPEIVRCHLIDVIKAKAPYADQQMVVVSWTMDGECPHITRCMKDYRFKPGVRILFHIVRCGESICIDKIAYRSDDPYEDGH